MDSAFKHSRLHSSFSIPRSSFRAGVSLLEVLVSIFVIMFGLLGVAAVLPLGTRNVAEIVRSDNAAACGASAVRSIRAWQLLNPNSWRWPDFSSADPKAATPTYATLSAAVSAGYLPFGPSSFAIDPLFIAKAAQTIGTPGANATDPRPGLFPYDPSTPTRTYWNTLPIYRITLPLQPTTLSWPQHEAFYDRFFRWHDDVDIPLPTEGAERPRQMFLCTDSAGRVLPKLPTDPATNPLPWLAQNQGDYTWMAIVTPSINEADVIWDPTSGNPSDASVPAARRLQYMVQIVVFHKRDFEVPANYLTADQAPPERTVTANMLSGGYGGGDVSLTVPTGTTPDYSSYLTLRKNQWIMLCGQAVFRNPSDATKYATTNVYRWYRVVSATEPPVADGANYVRYVTLAGPDWSTEATAGWCYRGGNPAGAYVDLDGDGNALDAAAVIADGVVGVYTMTFEVDRDTQTVILGP